MRRTLPPDSRHASARTGIRLSSHRGAARAALPAPEAGRRARLSWGRHADRAVRAGMIGDVESTLEFAEFGVVLLLFLVGLELQPSRLWVLRRPVFGLGGAQVLA